MCAFVKLECFPFLQFHSELLLLHAIGEEEEDGFGLAILGVGEADGSLGVHALTHEDLHLIELADDELGKLGGTGLEARDAVLLAVLLHEANGLDEESLDHTDEVLLGKGKLDKLVSVNDVDDGFTLLFVLFIIGYKRKTVR